MSEDYKTRWGTIYVCADRAGNRGLSGAKRWGREMCGLMGVGMNNNPSKTNKQFNMG